MYLYKTRLFLNIEISIFTCSFHAQGHVEKCFNRAKLPATAYGAVIAAAVRWAMSTGNFYVTRIWIRIENFGLYPDPDP